MATFTIVADKLTNEPPYQTGTLYLQLGYNETYVFTKDDFTINTIPEYKDPEDDDLLKIKIIAGFTASVTNGSLLYNGIPVTIGTEILVSDIINGDLIYTADPAFQSSYTDVFFFDVADEGSENYGGLQGQINILTGVKVNDPAQIGDGYETVEHGDTLVFTRDMFTTQTTPPYYDPEGDAALLLKVVTLPTKGKLYLLDSGGSGPAASKTLVEENDVIDFSDIDQGLFIYEATLLQAGSAVTVDFQFGIADAGSGIFTY